MTVRNTGVADGAEVVQVYVGQQGPSIFRPEQELKEFAKVFLEAGEARRLTFTLDTRSFAVWDVASGDWVVPDGVYRISYVLSSRDVRLQAALRVRGVALETPRALPCWYVDPAGPPTQADFEGLLGRRIERAPVRVCKGEYTLASSCEDMKGSFVVRQFVRMVERSIGKGLGGVDYADPAFRMAMAGLTTSPIRRLSQLSPARMPPNLTTGLVRLANGKILQGLSAMAKSRGAAPRTAPTVPTGRRDRRGARTAGRSSVSQPRRVRAVVPASSRFFALFATSTITLAVSPPPSRSVTSCRPSVLIGCSISTMRCPPARRRSSSELRPRLAT